ncbi:hypothetical protein A2U01_0071768 [Trifolium medium]|uniref:Uncharacterized protein n=1 Tax=Trifolium medium TaxID=97028 RepID=A0A392SQN0_9FABA|nr:hypothetical protein [Trifolium medium]
MLFRISKNIALSPPLAGRHLATERQKVGPPLATTGDNLASTSPGDKEPRLVTPRRTECSVAV